MKTNLQRNSVDGSAVNPQQNFDFDEWARLVRSQLLASLHRRGCR